MSADEVEGAGEPFVGFHTFADDTPRDLPETPARGSQVRKTWITPPDDLSDGADWPGLRQVQPNRNRLWIALLVIALAGGSAGALVLGVGRQTPQDAQLALNASSHPMPIHVAPAAPPLAMTAIGTPEPMDTHASAPLTQAPSVKPSPTAAATPKTSPPTDRLAQLAAQFPAARGQAEPAAPPSPVPVVTVAPALPEPPPAQLAALAPRNIPAPQTAELAQPAQPRPSPMESCRYARTRAELMVCSDPELAAEDRQVTQAYRAAIAAGAPQGRLAREQRDWLNAREDAARRSRRDVQSLYALRLDDLAQWIDDDPPETRR